MTGIFITLMISTGAFAQEAASLVIAPGAANVIVGDIADFAATAYDVDDNVVTAVVTWSLSGDAGTLEMTGDATATFTATAAGTCTLSAVTGSVIALDVTITVEEPAPVPDHIVITPAEAEAEVGDSVEFTAVVYDINETVIETAVVWSTDGGIGSIDEAGLFAAETAGEGTVTAAVDEISADAVVTVTEPAAPTPDHIVITPAEAEAEVGETVAFSAVVYDADDNELEAVVVWTTDGGIGSIDEAGLFEAETAGEGTVTAAVDEVSADAVVTVTEPAVPVPDHIAVTPVDPDVEVGDTVEFTAVVYDVDENVIEIEVTWSTDGDIGSIDEDGLFTAESQGMGHVIAQAGDAEASVEIHVSANGQGGNGQNPAEIHVYPANAMVTVGGTVQFEVAVFGPDEEAIEDAEVVWTVADETYGTISEDGLFTASAIGATEVTAAVGEISATADVTVVEEIPEVDGPTITVKRQFPDGSIKNFGAPIAVGNTLVLGGIPHPFNYLNGAHIYFPEGCISQDILLMIKIPEFAKVKGNSVEFDGDILTAVTFEVFVDGELVHPFYFDVPVEVTLPYKYGILKKMGVDPSTLGMYYVGQDGQLYREGIWESTMDAGNEGITAKLAHFSDIVLAPKDSPTAVDATPSPAAFSLGANYPNPFNPETTIGFSLGTASDIRLDIYTITGQHIRTLAAGMTSAGTHSVVWDGADDHGNHLTSGMYIYRLTAGAFTQSRKLMLMK